MATLVLGIVALVVLSALPLWAYQRYTAVKSELALTKEKIRTTEARNRQLNQNLSVVRTVPFNVKAIERAKVLWVASLFPEEGVPRLFDSQRNCDGLWTGQELQAGDDLLPLKISERSCAWSGGSAFFAISFVLPEVDSNPTIFIGAWSNKEHVTGDAIELR